MNKVKAFLDWLLAILGKLALIVAALILIAVMSIWTVGLGYVATKLDCGVTQGQVVCDVRK